jgi:hypothetical protein
MTTKIAVETKEQMGQLMKQLQSSTPQTHQPDGKRKQWRMTYDTVGILDWKDDFGNSEPIYISIQDITIDGLGFFSRCRFVIGHKSIITVTTELGEFEVPATVVHCTATLGVFHVGVKFDFLTQ